jgi:DNA replication protein DnaC
LRSGPCRLPGDLIADVHVRYARASRLLQQSALAHADGSYPKLLDAFARIQFLVLDDWGDLIAVIP